MKYVHPPQLILLRYAAPDGSNRSWSSPFLEAVYQAHSQGQSHLELPNHLLYKAVQDQLENFYAKATGIGTLLGSWAANYFIAESIQRLVRRAGMNDSLWADPVKARLAETLGHILQLTPSTPGSSSTVSEKVCRLLAFLREENNERFSGIIFVRERATAYVLAAVIRWHPLTQGLFQCASYDLVQRMFFSNSDRARRILSLQRSQKTLEKILNTGGGALFIDEAYQLAQGSSFGGTQVLDFLLAEVEKLTGKIVFILAGYQQPMEKFFSHNPGLPSRFPHELKFNDYDDDKLVKIFDYSIKKHYKNQMKVEDGPSGLYSRIVARRVGRGRGREGFANARAIENIRARIAERQSERLKRERLIRVGQSDDFLLTKEDLIGLEPSQALESSSAWQKLKSMIGLGSVKTTVQSLLDSIQYNYQRELQVHPLEKLLKSLNYFSSGSGHSAQNTMPVRYEEIMSLSSIVDVQTSLPLMMLPLRCTSLRT
ncbi:hypothetical protein BBP40_001530 [Aspergillus hancockii]|nr:hypothetical protein BBP40_001530 [Aspergillus hancockii]